MSIQSALRKTASAMAVGGLAGTVMLPLSAEGAGRCGERNQVVAQLKSVHGEVRQNVGLQRNARVMETYANDETGSWTIIVSMPSGMACLVAAGEAYQDDPKISIQSSKDDPA